MQVRKVAVVATGALATAAAMGSTPAFAADSAAAPQVAPAAVGLLDNEGANRASDKAMRELAEQWLTVAPEQAMTAPWEQEPPKILSVGSGSALSVAPWQQCASSGPFILGGAAPIASPMTVLDDCRNGNIDIAGNGGDPALISLLDGTALSALSFQQCASGVGGAGIGVPIASPHTVAGGCDNGNLTVGSPEDGPDGDPPAYDYHEAEPAGTTESEQTESAKTEAAATTPVAENAEATTTEQTMPGGAPWEQEPPQVLSAGSGSAASGASWQQCASTGGWILGGAAPLASPLTVLDDCRNGNIDIHGEPSDALFSGLDHSAVSVASFQQCASGAGGASVSIPVASPLTVMGSCDNGNITIN